MKDRALAMLQWIRWQLRTVSTDEWDAYLRMRGYWGPDRADVDPPCKWRP